MMLHRPILFFIFFFGLLFSLPAQNTYQVKRFTTEDGLPSDGIKGIQWDGQNGFLWVATESGVVRYNGADFKTFSKDNTPELTARRMYFMLKNRDGRIYTVDEKGDIFFVEQNRLQFMYRCPIVTRDSYFRLVGLAASTKLFRQSSGSPPSQIGFNLGNGQMIPLSGTRMLLFSQDTLYDYTLGKIMPDFIMALEPGSRLFLLDGQLFVFNGRQQIFYQLDPDTKKATRVAVKLVKPSSPDPQKSYPLAARERLPGLPAKEEERIFWDYGMDEPILIKDSLAWTLGYKDHRLISQLICTAVPADASLSFAQYSSRRGILFLGAGSKGIIVIRKNQVRPVKRSAPSLNRVSSYYSQIRLSNGSILTDEGDVLGGPPPPPSDFPVIKSPVNPNREFNNFVYLTPDSTLWYDHDVSLYSYSYKTHQTIPYFDGKGSIVDGLVQSEGVLYIANAIGIGIIQGGEITYLHKHPQANINGNVPFSMVELQPGILAIATCNGLWQYNTHTNHLDTLWHTPDICVRALWKYKDYLFIGTYGQGIYIMKNGVIKSIPLDKAQYLLNAHCFFPDKQGFCWISTNKGIFRADPAEMVNSFENKHLPEIYYHYFGKNDGMDITELNGGCTPCALLVNDSTLSFPSMDGLIWVNPASPPPNQAEGRVFIDEFGADGKKIDISSVSTPITLDNPRDLIFHLGFPAWTNKENIYVEYKLVPYSNEWQPLDISKDTIISFPSLPSGDFRLLIRKLNGFGEGNYASTEFGFRIQPLWYQQTWVRLIGLFLLIAGVIVIIRFRNRQSEIRRRKLRRQVKEQTLELRQKDEELEKADFIKTRLVSIIGHDLITPLKFLHLAGKSLIEQKNELSEELREEAVTEIMNTSKELELLSTNILNWIKYRNDDRPLVKEGFSLYALTEQLFKVFNSVAKPKKIGLVNRIDRSIEIFQYIDPLRVILSNLILNGINFTSEGGHVIVSSEITGNRIAITVKDTGMGMLPEQIKNVMADHFIISSANVDNRKGNGLGYLIIKDLLKTIGGKVSIESKKEEGTEVTIRLKK